MLRCPAGSRGALLLWSFCQGCRSDGKETEMLKIRISYDDFDEADKIMEWIASGAYIRRMKQQHKENHSLIYLDMERPRDLMEILKDVQRETEKEIRNGTFSVPKEHIETAESLVNCGDS